MSNAIVCLDGYTLNPGDISWDPFKQIGPLTVYDRTEPDQIVSRAQPAAYVLTNKTPLSAPTISALPNLKYIGVLATGYNVVDTSVAAERGIVVTNVPTYGTDSVAQHAFALILEMSRHVALHHQAVQRGQWTSCKDWCFALAPISELTGRTLGVMGMGRIGRAVARIGAAMDMRLIGHDIYWPSPAQLGDLKVESVSVDEIFGRSDVLSLHCPLTDETHHLVNAERLQMMKPDALLINTSRGPLVDNAALAEALTSKQIGAAALDVLDVEPPAADNPLLTAPNCIITPHIAWYASASRQRLMELAASSLKTFINGKPTNKVN